MKEYFGSSANLVTLHKPDASEPAAHYAEVVLITGEIEYFIGKNPETNKQALAKDTRVTETRFHATATELRKFALSLRDIAGRLEKLEARHPIRIPLQTDLPLNAPATEE